MSPLPIDRSGFLGVCFVRCGAATAGETPLIATIPPIVIKAVVDATDSGFSVLCAMRPDVVVLDMRATSLDVATRALQRVRRLLPGARLVAIGDPGADEHARVALLGGAHAYEGGGVSPARVRRAVLFAAAGIVHLNSTGKRAAVSARAVRGRATNS